MNKQRRQRIRRHLVAASAFAAAIGAQAQQRDNLAPVPTVVVTAEAGSYDSRRDDTAAKIVIGSDELARFGDASIADAVKRVPGITVISTGRGADIRMRGLGSGYTQILVNGERAPAGFSVDALDPVQVERVEIIPSATAELSTESIAGTINIVLKKTVRTAQRQVQFGFGGDATERTPRLEMLLADRAGAFSYSLSANGRVTSFHRHALIDDTETTPAGAPVTRIVTSSGETGRLSVVNLIPRLSWTLANGDTLSSDTSLSFNAFHFSASRQSAATLGPPPEFAQFDWRIQTRNVAGKSDLVWTTRPAPETKLEMKVGVQATTGSNDSDRILLGDAMTLPSYTAVATREAGFNTSGKLSSRLADTHQMTAGWEASRIRRTESNDETDVSGDGGGATGVLTGYAGTVVRPVC